MSETTQRTETPLNGVAVERLQATIETIERAPGLATFRFRAHNHWVNGGHSRTSIRGFYGAGQEDTSRKQTFELDSDEPVVLLGGDTAANPAEYVLHALAGCITTNLVYLAATQGIELRSVESRLTGSLDLRGMLGLSKTVRCGYEGIDVRFRIESDAPCEEIEALLELARSRSPVSDMLEYPVPVQVRLAD